MIDCVSVANMRRSDLQTIENGTSSIELICRAAHGVFCSVEWSWPVAVVCGSGNNGADGFALAGILHENGIPCTVFTVSERLHEDTAYYAEKARSENIPILAYRLGVLRAYPMIVDCMLGTGFQGVPRTLYAQAIGEINECDSYVVSVDINSGMNGDSGAGEIIVASDLTVAIGFVKNGQILPSSGKYMKRLVCVDIGIGLSEPENKICSLSEWQSICMGRQIGTETETIVSENMIYYPCPPWLDMNVQKEHPL